MEEGSTHRPTERFSEEQLFAVGSTVTVEQEGAPSGGWKIYGVKEDKSNEPLFRKYLVKMTLPSYRDESGEETIFAEASQSNLLRNNFPGVKPISEAESLEDLEKYFQALQGVHSNGYINGSISTSGEIAKHSAKNVLTHLDTIKNMKKNNGTQQSVLSYFTSAHGLRATVQRFLE